MVAAGTCAVSVQMDVRRHLLDAPQPAAVDLLVAARHRDVLGSISIGFVIFMLIFGLFLTAMPVHLDQVLHERSHARDVVHDDARSARHQHARAAQQVDHHVEAGFGDWLVESGHRGRPIYATLHPARASLVRGDRSTGEQ